MLDHRIQRFETPDVALAAAVAAKGDSDAFVFPSDRLTFQEWDRQSTALARALLDLGFVVGDRIGLLAQNSVEWPVAQMAVAKAGMILVPLNTHYRLDDLKYALAHARVRAVFLTTEFRSNPFLALVRQAAPSLPNLRSLILFDGAQEGCLDFGSLIQRGTSSRSELPPVSGSDTAAIIYTSGTTGFPKGAMLTHESVMADGYLTFQRLGLDGDDRITSIVPMFHSASFCVAVSGCLQAGATFFGHDAFDPVEMFKTIQQHRCTVHVGVPTSLHMMLNHPRRGEFDLSSLRVGTCGGADADPDLLRRCAKEFPMPGLVQIYGLTESAGIATCSSADDPNRFSTAGLPLDGFELRITDRETGRPVSPDEIGQVEIKSRFVMRGYLDNPEETRKTMTTDGLLRTGDLGHLREDGRLILSGGRLKDMIIRGGENIYPAEIELVLANHHAVSEVAVFGLKDDRFGEIVAAAIRGGDISADELTAFCAERIAKFKVPARYFRVESFPLTPSGKIRKVDLREMAAVGRLQPLI
jgi:fatty-acyl-CoA synthase